MPTPPPDNPPAPLARRGKPPLVSTLRRKKLIAFGWYGGKFSHLDWLLPLLPAAHHYCEPFAGSGAVLLNRAPSPVETYNDLDGEVVNFFRVLREQKEALTEAIGLTPFSREEFGIACLLEPDLSPLERARRFYVRARQVRTGLAQTASIGRWANCKDTSRAGMSGVVSRWLGGVEALPEIAERLLRVQIENRPAVDVIRLYDSPQTLFYCLAPGTLVRTADERFLPVECIGADEVLFSGRVVQRRMQRHHRGEMLAITIQSLPDLLKVTGEHRILRIPRRTCQSQEQRTDQGLWKRREVVSADQLEVGDYLLVPLGGAEADILWQWNDTARKRGVRRSGLQLHPSPALFRLMGYYAAEGHIQRGGRAGKYATGVVLSFGTHEEETWVKDAAKCAESAFGITAGIRVGPAPSVTQVVLWSSTVAEFIQSYVIGTALDKRLHPDLMTAPSTVQREILIGWLRGDGGLECSSRNRSKLLGTTRSEALARQMFTIALRCGLRPSFKRRGRSYDVYFASDDATKLGWQVPGRRNCSSRRIINGHMLVRVRRIEREDYNGPVYDLDVDGNDLFTAPYALVHNCDPPYLHETRGDTGAYGYEMTDEQHRELAEVLNTVFGKVAISNYQCDLMDRLYPAPKWIKTTSAERTIHSTKDKRSEALWTNYDPREVLSGQASLLLENGSRYQFEA